MSITKRIKELCDEKATTFAAVERICDLSNGSIRRWEENKPSVDKLEKVAEFFNVSIDFLLSKTDNRIILTNKDEKDIAKDIEKLKEKLKSSEGLMFDGEPASDEAIQSVLEAMSFGVRQAKLINKKYTPKKYIDNDNNDGAANDKEKG